MLEQTPEAMRFLQTRFQRTKGKAAGPARALFYALSEQDEMSSAFGILDQAFHAGENATNNTHREETGEVLLFGAEMRANYNEPELAAELLTKAREYATRSSWLRTAARVALIRTDLREARRRWEDLLGLEPLAHDAMRICAGHRRSRRTRDHRELAEADGRKASASSSPAAASDRLAARRAARG